MSMMDLTLEKWYKTRANKKICTKKGIHKTNKDDTQTVRIGEGNEHGSEQNGKAVSQLKKKLRQSTYNVNPLATSSDS